MTDRESTIDGVGSGRVIEVLNTFTPLGLRFVDSALDQPVRDRLRVSAWPVDGDARPRTARTTPSGVHAFHGLPGLREIEHAVDDDTAHALPMRRFVVEIVDESNRFVALALEIELPLTYRGVYRLGGESDGIDAVPLFSAPQRRRPAWFGVVRGTLHDIDRDRPAAHALVSVIVDGGSPWHGLTDAAGRFAVWLEYPVAAGEMRSTPTAEREWSIRLSVRHRAAEQTTLPRTTLPDFTSILGQSEAHIWSVLPSMGGIASAEWTGTLRYGHDCIVRGADDGPLLVGPPPPSP